MKIIKGKIATAGLVVALAFAASAQVSQITVINTIAELLAKPATFGEVLIVLGEVTPFDSPLRLAKHFRTLVYPINGVNVFPATNSGEWYLVPLSSGSVAQGVQTNFIANCPVDGSNHEITLGIYGSTYALQVNQSPSVQLPVSLYLEAEDSTSHKVTISLDSGVYGLSVAQANSVVAPIFFALAAEDSSEHIVNLTTNFGGYTISVNQ